MRRIISSAIVVAAFALVALVAPAVTFAASTPTLNQTVNAGTLTTDILQNDGSTPVAAPAVNFGALTKNFSCQTATGTLGDSNNKVYVTNLANNSGFTLAIAATSGPGTSWTSGSDTYSFDDPAGTGCTNGQMTVDPSVGTVTDDCSSSCGSASVSKGSSTAFSNGSADSITLLSESTGNGWKGYLTGVNLSQKVPSLQVSGSYSLGMTITVTAL